VRGLLAIMGHVHPDHCREWPHVSMPFHAPGPGPRLIHTMPALACCYRPLLPGGPCALAARLGEVFLEDPPG
jgi:hypothetical protein